MCSTTLPSGTSPDSEQPYIAGNAVCDDGMMIDLSSMKAVEVASASGRVRVEPGATLADMDRATQAHGLAVPVGINSTTGVAGLTLGGGFGWLSRKLGMTVDCLLGADVVTADGEMVRADRQENPDLFWAIRGGGGNFGVVTAFDFQAARVGPTSRRRKAEARQGRGSPRLWRKLELARTGRSPACPAEETAREAPRPGVQAPNPTPFVRILLRRLLLLLDAGQGRERDRVA